jgi:hypothetical protein
MITRFSTCSLNEPATPAQRVRSVPGRNNRNSRSRSSGARKPAGKLAPSVTACRPFWPRTAREPVDRDLGAWPGNLGRFMPIGFYHLLLLSTARGGALVRANDAQACRLGHAGSGFADRRQRQAISFLRGYSGRRRSGRGYRGPRCSRGASQGPGRRRGAPSGLDSRWRCRTGYGRIWSPRPNMRISPS